MAEAASRSKLQLAEAAIKFWNLRCGRNSHARTALQPFICHCAVGSHLLCSIAGTYSASNTRRVRCGHTHCTSLALAAPELLPGGPHLWPDGPQLGLFFAPSTSNWGLCLPTRFEWHLGLLLKLCGSAFPLAPAANSGGPRLDGAAVLHSTYSIQAIAGSNCSSPATTAMAQAQAAFVVLVLPATMTTTMGIPSSSLPLGAARLSVAMTKNPVFATWWVFHGLPPLRLVTTLLSQCWWCDGTPAWQH